MPEKNSTFILSREFSAEQIAALRRGNIPKEMEDKWFWFMEGDTLYAHRSWTGICVYRIDFSFADNQHKVTVNQDPEQVGITKEEEDRRTLNNLLNWWSQPEYDHNGEWISETVDTLKQAGQIPKDAEDYRKEGLELEQQGKLEEAYQQYEEAAKLNDAPSMFRIARMYLSGKFRPIDSSNLSQLLLQCGPIFPWSPRNEKQPDCRSGLEWLTRAADLGSSSACEMLGNMLCRGIGCKADMEKGITYLEKAAASGSAAVQKYLCLYRPSGKKLTDEEYERCLTEFVKAAEAQDDRAYELYAALKSGTYKQLARLGYAVVTAQNVRRAGFGPFRHSATSSGIPLVPVLAKRWAWGTFLRFNLDAWAEKYPLIADASDNLDPNRPEWMLEKMHRAKIIGRAAYTSPAFGWLREEKKAVVIRLGDEHRLDHDSLTEVVQAFGLRNAEYRGSVAFMVENGEKEYSFEVAGINGQKVDVLWRYTIGGSNQVHKYFEPKLISLDIE